MSFSDQSKENIMDTFARQSMVSVLLTALIITVNHFYSLGPRAFLLGAVLLTVPAALMWWFTITKSRVAFAGYMLMNLWIIVGFGLMKGLWKGIFRLFLGTLLASLSPSFPRPTIGTYWFEASGILTFVGGLSVLYTAYRLIRSKLDATPGNHMRHRSSSGKALVAAGAVSVFMVAVGSYLLMDQDKWTAPSNGIVRIGVIVPSTGPFAVLGNSFLKAVEMAKDDLKGTRYQYQLVNVDVPPDPVRARDLIQKVIDEDKVDAILGGISLIGRVTKPYATEARVPHLCVCSITSIGDGGYNFTNIPAPEAEATRWVKEAQKRGIKTIALLFQDYVSINNHVRAFKTEVERAGLQIVYEAEFDGETTDFRQRIEQAKALAPDVFYVEALNPALDILGQQLSDAKIHNIASVVAPSVSQKQELFEGAWYTDSNLPDMGFKRRFEEKYPNIQFATHMMPYAYDDFNMIVKAFEQDENPSVYLRNITTYDGTAGLLTKEPRSGNFLSTPAVWMIKDGKPVLVEN
jgi:ABC-type branched-subunit amino acid transport system substrate-binding protein